MSVSVSVVVSSLFVVILSLVTPSIAAVTKLAHYRFDTNPTDSAGYPSGPYDGTWYSICPASNGAIKSTDTANSLTVTPKFGGGMAKATGCGMAINRPSTFGDGSAFSVSYWFYPTAGWTVPDTVLTTPPGANPVVYGIQFTGSGLFRLGIENQFTILEIADGNKLSDGAGSCPYNVDINNWFHIVIIYEPSSATHTVRSYVNNNLNCFNGLGSGTSYTINMDKLEALHSTFGGGSNVGYVDELQLFQGALTTGEISNLFNYNNHLGLIVGDPTIIGFNGVHYQVHGVNGGIYSFLSSCIIQLNAKFSFISKGRNLKELRNTFIKNMKDTTNPMIPPLTPSWSHSGQYISSLGLKYLIPSSSSSSSKEISFIIQSGEYLKGFSAIQINQQSIPIQPSSCTLSSLLTPSNTSCTNSKTNNNDNRFCFEIRSSFSIWIRMYPFELEIINADQFINIHSVNLLNKNIKGTSDSIEGLLGRTLWADNDKNNNKLNNDIDGEETVASVDNLEDYLIGDNNLLSDNFHANRYGGGDKCQTRKGSSKDHSSSDNGNEVIDVTILD